MKAKPRETLKDPHKMLIQLIQQHNIAKPQKHNIIRRILCAQQQWLPILPHSTAQALRPTIIHIPSIAAL